MMFFIPCVLFVGLGLAAKLPSGFGDMKYEFQKGFLHNDDSLINNLVGVTMGKCATGCIFRPKCVAAEYIYRFKNCKLLSSIKTAQTRPGSISVLVNDQQRPTCGTERCASPETCSITENQCVYEECGYPSVRGKNAQGNLFTVNSIILHTCKGTPQQFKCGSDGFWDPVEGHSVMAALTCSEIQQQLPEMKSGVYRNKHGLEIYCDMETDGGRWIVFQSRFDGSVDFYRNWVEYQNGFGDIRCGEFWFGLENLVKILHTADINFELRIDLEDWDGNTAYAKYDKFHIGGESDMYRLHVEGYSGTAGNSLIVGNSWTTSNGQAFTTKDVDNDNRTDENCAVRFHGAWWYNSCHNTNLNGLYYNQSNADFGRGINWFLWKGYLYSLKATSMKLRERK